MLNPVALDNSANTERRIFRARGENLLIHDFFKTLYFESDNQYSVLVIHKHIGNS